MSTDEIRADAPQDPAQSDDAVEDPSSADNTPADDASADDTRAARARRLGDRLATAARRGAALPATLAVATVAATALSGWLCVEVYEQRAAADRQQDVLAAARQSALNFTSLDYRHYDRDSQNVLKGATGDFKKQFAAQTDELTKLVAANKSVSQGQVLEAGIVSADEKSARVLVVADSKVTNTAAPEGQARTYRLQLDLVLERGRWLTSDVEFVG
jgi:Mce-associated membrane protein